MSGPLLSISVILLLLGGVALTVWLIVSFRLRLNASGDSANLLVRVSRAQQCLLFGVTVSIACSVVGAVILTDPLKANPQALWLSLAVPAPILVGLVAFAWRTALSAGAAGQGIPNGTSPRGATLTVRGVTSFVSLRATVVIGVTLAFAIIAANWAIFGSREVDQPLAHAASYLAGTLALTAALWWSLRTDAMLNVSHNDRFESVDPTLRKALALIVITWWFVGLCTLTAATVAAITADNAWNIAAVVAFVCGHILLLSMTLLLPRQVNLHSHLRPEAMQLHTGPSGTETAFGYPLTQLTSPHEQTPAQSNHHGVTP